MQDSVKKPTEVKVYDTYFFVLFRRQTNTNLLLSVVGYLEYFVLSYLLLLYLAHSVIYYSYILQMLTGVCWMSVFFSAEEVNLPFKKFYQSTFPVLFLKVVVIYQTIFVGVAEYSEMTASLLLMALKTVSLFFMYLFIY